MKEYKIAKGWAILVYLFGPLIIGLFGYGLILPFQDGKFSPGLALLLVPASLGMIGLMVFGLVDAYRGRIIIGKDRITSIGAVSTREFLLNEIKGYTKDENYISVHSKAAPGKRIRISRYTDGYADILHWLSQRYADLEVQETIREEKKMLRDRRMGRSKQEREEKLLTARKTARLVNWSAGIASVWVMLFPVLYQFAILTAALIPLVALFISKRSNGLIRLDERKGSAYPGISVALIFPALGIAIRSMLDYNVFSYENLWLPVGALTVFLTGIVVIGEEQIPLAKKTGLITAGSLAIFMFAYSYGIVIQYNCYYDGSEAQVYQARILNKRMNTGRHVSRHLKLSAWGPQKETEEVSVGNSLYNRTKIGDQINVYYRPGNLAIPWISMNDK